VNRSPAVEANGTGPDQVSELWRPARALARNHVAARRFLAVATVARADAARRADLATAVPTGGCQ
jgi:hypothetical protein